MQLKKPWANTRIPLASNNDVVILVMARGTLYIYIAKMQVSSCLALFKTYMMIISSWDLVKRTRKYRYGKHLQMDKRIPSTTKTIVEHEIFNSIYASKKIEMFICCFNNVYTQCTYLKFMILMWFTNIIVRKPYIKSFIQLIAKKLQE